MQTIQYEPINIPASDLERIKLPKFQRKFVWPKKKKDSFIETLHKGFPFGSILVYPENQGANSELLIIDGQQRLSTIMEFRKDPLSFWKPNNETAYSEALERINSLLPEESQLNEREFDESLRLDVQDFYNWLVKVTGASGFEEINAEFSNIKKSIKDYVDLSHLLIPAIKYIGAREYIADVFSRLNQGGIPLTKYQVYSAAWAHTKIVLSASKLQNEILENVKNYYSSVSKDVEFELDGFSEDELTNSRTITLSDFGMAIGIYAQAHLKALIPDTESKIPEIGFGLLAIAVDLDNRKLGNLIDYSCYIETNLQIILEKIERICNNLQDVFSKLLKTVKDNKSDSYALGLSTTFKTLSYFAALWHLDPSSSDYKNTLKNIKGYYLYDSLTKAWSGAGDLRLLGYQAGTKERDYLRPIEIDAFEKAFEQWIDSRTAGRVNFTGETKAIITIHANLTYLAKTVPSGESFELEHIIARKLIKDADQETAEALFGNSIGNCMFLPSGLNNKKKYKTLYDVNDDNRYTWLIRESFYFPEADLNDAINAIADGRPDDANRIIRKRAQLVGSSTAKALLA